MADTGKHPSGADSFKPKHQASEDHGSVKGVQLTDRMMREKDLPRGSEEETRSAARRP